MWLTVYNKVMLKKIFLSLALALATFTSAPAMVYAAPSCPSNNTPKGQVYSGLGSAGDCDESGVTDFISTTVNILSIVIGIAAVIVIILSGFKFITSGGDSSKVATAKNTLIYALIGLVVAALAQFLVHFVLSAATK